MELITPAKFDVYDEPSNYSSSLGDVREISQNLIRGKGINATQPQRAILLHCAGNEVQDIAENNITDTGTDFTTFST